MCSLLALYLHSVSSFSPSVQTLFIPTQARIIHPNTSGTSLRMSADDDINRQLAKAKIILEKAKAKVAQMEAEGATAVKQKSSAEKSDKKTSVLKSKNEVSGLSTYDGDLMAALSEEEDWELKGMFDVFDDEIEESDVSKNLGKRDVAASILNLRRSMHNDDYRRIFDKRNFYIGEDN